MKFSQIKPTKEGTFWGIKLSEHKTGVPSQFRVQRYSNKRKSELVFFPDQNAPYVYLKKNNDFLWGDEVIPPTVEIVYKIDLSDIPNADTLRNFISKHKIKPKKKVDKK